MSNKSLIIIGTGDYAEIAYAMISQDCNIEIKAFSVERNFLKEKNFCGLPVIAFEDIEQHFPKDNHQIIVCIGPNKVNTIRQRLFEESIKKGYAIYTYISPRASVWDPTQIGRGAFIFDQCIVEAFASIGDNTVLWSGATVAHHSTIGHHCFLAPSCAISGRITIENNCFIGINATIRDNITIAEKCIVGGGAVIKKSTTAGGVYSAQGTVQRSDDSLNTHI